jgi:hypothetical protein
MEPKMPTKAELKRQARTAEIEAASIERNLPTVKMARIAAIAFLEADGWTWVQERCEFVRAGERGRLSYIPAFGVHPELIRSVELVHPGGEYRTTSVVTF